MQKPISYLLVFLLLLGCRDAAQNASRKAYVPDEQLGALFHDVQMARIFPDSKTFADCRPRFPVEDITAAYGKERKRAGFALRDFVYRNFVVPEPQTVPPTSPEVRTMAEHIRSNWSRLIRPPDSLSERSSLLPLPHPYVVPGGRFREIYYWDTYFTCLGLAASGRWDLVGNMTRNFAYLIDTYGFIPNGNRTYYLSRSQPPFFSHMVMLLGEFKGLDTAAVYLPQLEKEYDFWMDGQNKLTEANPAHKHVVRLADGVYLNRYWDAAEKPRPEAYHEDFTLAQGLPEAEQKRLYRNIRAACESGWDFSSRWFADGQNLRTIRTTDIIPVDLNALLYVLEATLATAYEKGGNTAAAQRYRAAATARKNAVNKYCWSAAMGWYSDYNHLTQKHTRTWTLAGMVPFFVQIAPPQYAAAAAQNIRSRFLQPGGLTTTLSRTGQQWDAPNGWAPLQWMSIAGLDQYGQKELAKNIAQRWVKLNTDVYQRTGKLMEKYNVIDLALEAGGGEYPSQDGFGWTNGVLLALKAKYGL